MAELESKPIARRVHIFGASGAGTTTLGRALASHWSVPHHDTDDYYWLPTTIPYSEKRPIPERLKLMEEMFLPRPSWVLSGSLISWSDTLEPFFDAVVYLSLDNETRLSRLRAREEQRFGAEAINRGGTRHKEFLEFMQWAALYEDPAFAGRSRASHEKWMAGLSCPVVRIGSSAPVDVLVQQVEVAL